MAATQTSRIVELAENVAELSTDMAVLKTHYTSLQSSADRNGRALFGNNGTPGIVARIDKIEEKLDDIKRLVVALTTAVLGAIIIQVLQMVF